MVPKVTKATIENKVTMVIMATDVNIETIVINASIVVTVR